MDQDDFLVQGCKAGNRQAQMELYRKYHHRVYNTCLRMVCIPEDAEDLMQNSFIDAFDRIKSYKGPSAFAGWLKRIAVNNAIDHLNRKKLSLEQIDHFPDITETVDESEEIIEWKVDQIKRAMHSLIPDYRVILSLYLFEGFDQEEIGQILRLSQANVRTRISRARHSLIRTITGMHSLNGSMNMTTGEERKK